MALKPRQVFDLFPTQMDGVWALRDGSTEVLVRSSKAGAPAGASHLLRVLALQVCAAPTSKHTSPKRHLPGVSALLLQKHGSDLFQRNLAGNDGIFALVREMQAKGFATVSQDEIRFRNGSTLRWSGYSRESEVSKLTEERFDVLLVDDVDEMPETLFDRLRAVAMQSAHPLRRIIAAGSSRAQGVVDGWPSRHWSVNGTSGRKLVLLNPEELDPDMIEKAAELTYRSWIERVHGGQWVWAPQVVATVSAIERWIAGDWQHLAIFMPSQQGKTTSGPRNAIPYLLGRFPADWCSIASYGSDIANSRSADARENYMLAGGELKLGRKRRNEWETLAGGGCWSAGTSAGQVGRTSSWGFIDDGDKDWADAVNGTQQARKRRWYGSTYRSRESMFAAEMRRQKICITATRWDPDDLSGYALTLGHNAGESWGVLVLPAIYDPGIADGYRKLYPKFDVIRDYRQEPGEPIWPDRRSADDWEVVFKIRGPIIADCECQQKPHGVERGGQFESDWFVPLDRDPAFTGKVPNEGVFAASCRAWDLGATEGAGDATAGVKMGRTADDGRIVVRHAVRAQFAPAGAKQLIALCMLLDGPRVSIRIPIDPAAGGQAQADEIIRYLRQVAGWAGLPLPQIIAKRPRHAATAKQSAKAARAHDLRSRAAPPGDKIPGGVSYVGAEWAPALSNVIGDDFDKRVSAHPELMEIARKAKLVAGDWWTPWLQEMRAFTGDDGGTDDQVDATVDAYEEIVAPLPGASGSTTNVPGWGY